MKKLFIIFTLIAFVFTAHAQTNELAGSWLIVKTEQNGKIKKTYFITDFKQDGNMEIMGMVVGTWQYVKNGNKIIFDSQMDKNFSGEGKILKLTAQELIIEKDGVKLFYQKIDPEKIAKTNAQAHLAGSWKMLGRQNTTTLLKFELPDNFTLLEASNGESQTTWGTWIYLADEKAIIFMSFSPGLRGKHHIKELTADSFILEKEGNLTRAQRLKTEATKIERLNFKEEDFPEEGDDPDKLPWRDFDQMAQFLNGVKSIKYQDGKLVEEFHTLKYTYEILSKIAVDLQKPSVDFTNLSIADGDTSQFSEKYKGGLTGRYDDFFPRDELYPYRILGTQTVEVPAGTFQCTVVEGFNTEQKCKYWMINDMPGIYAKIIQESVDPFGELEYSVTELKEINFTK